MSSYRHGPLKSSSWVDRQRCDLIPIDHLDEVQLQSLEIDHDTKRIKTFVLKRNILSQVSMQNQKEVVLIVFLIHYRFSKEKIGCKQRLEM